MTEIAKQETAVDKALGADPGPLGLFAFAFTTLLLSMINVGVLTGAGVPIVIALALFWGGLSQMIAGAFEMRKGNTFGFTAFTSYGAFWLFFALVQIVGALHIFTVDVPTLAWSLLFWGVFTLLMWIPAMMANKVLNVVFLLLWITFFLLAGGAFLAVYGAAAVGGIVTQIGGGFGLLTAAAAMYGGLAGVMNSMGGHLPVGKGAGKGAKKAERVESTQAPEKVLERVTIVVDEQGTDEDR